MSLELELDSSIIKIEAHVRDPVLAHALLAGYQLDHYQLLHAA